MNEVRKAGDAAEGAIGFIGWSTMSDAAGNQSFVQNYRAKYGIQPEPWAAQSYATLYVLANAIKTAQSTDAAAIRGRACANEGFPDNFGQIGRVLIQS